MGRWYRNQGFNRNLLVQLSGGLLRYQIDVYVVARFQFFYAPGAQNWTRGENEEWKRRFAGLVYHTWSEKWTLLSDISCALIDVDRAEVRLPRARVRVHAVDVENPSVPLPSQQRIYAVEVYRRAPGQARQRQDATALETSGATVGNAANSRLPAGTSRARIYEDSLVLGPPSSVDGSRQVTSMHEFGHMLGLMHPNDMQPGCTMDRSAPICYGQAYSPESRSIMGRGQEIHRDDYRVFVHIISRLVRELPSAGLSGRLGIRHRLFWMVEGSHSVWCEGQYGQSVHLGQRSHDSWEHARSPGPFGSRGTRGHGRRGGPLGLRNAWAGARRRGPVGIA